MHHPFTAPVNDDHGGARRPTRTTRSRKAYDMVLNGCEIGGGSVRIHREDMQSTVFELLGIGAEEAQLQVRLPARRAASTARRRTAASRSASTASSMLMAGADSDPRRDRVPEDADRAVTCSPTRRPEIPEKQLRELHIRVQLPPKT